MRQANDPGNPRVFAVTTKLTGPEKTLYGAVAEDYGGVSTLTHRLIQALLRSGLPIEEVEARLSTPLDGGHGERQGSPHGARRGRN